MNVVVTNSPVIPSGEEAGSISSGTYTPSIGLNDQWELYPTPGGSGGAIYLQHNGASWQLYNTYNVVIVQSSPVAITVPPWQATWPSPMVVALPCDPRFDMHAYGDECGEKRFRRLRLLGYL